MSTALVSNKELAITLKFTICKTDLVVIVVTVKCHGKFIEPKTLAVFGVALCFFDFSNHPIVHVRLLLCREMKKARRQARAFQECLTDDVR
jgi:hypothetical protein